MELFKAHYVAFCRGSFSLDLRDKKVSSASPISLSEKPSIQWSVISNSLQNSNFNLTSKPLLDNVGWIPLEKGNIWALLQARQVWGYFAFKGTHSLSAFGAGS